MTKLSQYTPTKSSQFGPNASSVMEADVTLSAKESVMRDIICGSITFALNFFHQLVNILTLIMIFCY